MFSIDRCYDIVYFALYQVLFAIKRIFNCLKIKKKKQKLKSLKDSAFRSRSLIRHIILSY